MIEETVFIDFTKSVVEINLKDAYLCINCDLLTNVLDICPKCSSKELYPLIRWIKEVK